MENKLKGWFWTVLHNFGIPSKKYKNIKNIKNIKNKPLKKYNKNGNKYVNKNR